ncbi:hypothetical protein B0H11DRAFT_2213760 [Mycena galericulata]|nr:hypothetical protein B0H11DRAFT_2213760 [Mycena galericulata]
MHRYFDMAHSHSHDQADAEEAALSQGHRDVPKLRAVLGALPSTPVSGCPYPATFQTPLNLPRWIPDTYEGAGAGGGNGWK